VRSASATGTRAKNNGRRIPPSGIRRAERSGLSSAIGESTAARKLSGLISLTSALLSTSADARHRGPWSSAARGRRRRRVDEGPFVVVRAAFVKSNRLIGALARHADHAADGRARTARADGRLCNLSSPSWLSSTSWLCRSALLPRRSAGATRSRRVRERHEVVVGNRILVFLSQKLLLNQHVQIGRIRVRGAALKHADGMSVLLAAEHKLFFFLALGHLSPDRQGRAHQDGHDRQPDNQGRHGIALLALSLGRRCGFALTR